MVWGTCNKNGLSLAKHIWGFSQRRNHPSGETIGHEGIQCLRSQSWHQARDALGKTLGACTYPLPQGVPSCHHSGLLTLKPALPSAHPQGSETWTGGSTEGRGLGAVRRDLTAPG